MSLVPVAVIAINVGFLVGLWWARSNSRACIRTRDEMIALLRQQRDDAWADTDRVVAEWGESIARMRRAGLTFDEASYRTRAKSKDKPS